jgi:hypothetical protein
LTLSNPSTTLSSNFTKPSNLLWSMSELEVQAMN